MKGMYLGWGRVNGEKRDIYNTFNNRDLKKDGGF